MGVVAAGVYRGRRYLHGGTVPVGEGGLQVGVQLGVPLRFQGQIAVDDLVVHRPHFSAPAHGPHGDFPAVILLVNPGHELQATHGHAAQGVVFSALQQGVAVGLFDLFFPGFAQGFVDEAFQRGLVARLFGGHALQELAHDGQPGGLRAVGRPDMEGDVARGAQQRGAGGVCPLVGFVVDAVVAATADPRAIAPNAQVVCLGDAAPAVGAVVAHSALGVVCVPLEAVKDFVTTPREGVFHTAMRAGDVEFKPGIGSGFALFDMAHARNAGRGAANDFGVGGPLKPLEGQGEGVCAFVDLLVERVKLVQQRGL